jgi:RNA polymerase sigma factor (TIGR02999 family)
LEGGPSSEITQQLQAWSRGDSRALDRVVELAYPELRNIAQRCMSGERPGHTITATELVHEAYLRLVDVREMQWKDRAHFFAVGARIMRRVLVDHARAKGRAKRQAGGKRVDFEDSLVVSGEIDPELIRLDDALAALEKFDPRKARVVEMRYFGGAKASEIADVLGVSPQTVNLDWSLAKAWLLREMSREDHDGSTAMGGN